MDTANDINLPSVVQTPPVCTPVDSAPSGLWSAHYPALVVIAVLGLSMLPGLVGHDPWKQDETYITEIVRHMLASGDWTVPTMAGVPFMEKPPLFYWVAAICAALSSPLLSLHDGARLATGIFVGGTGLATAWVGHRWWRQGRVSLLILFSSLGMVRHCHFMLTDLAMMTGFAVAICGLALCHEKWVPGGLLLGTGVGIGFLAKGLLAPGVLGVCALLLPLFFPRWRRRNFLRTLAISLAAAAPWLLIWPLALFYRSPPLFMEWFWLNNIGRFAGFSVPQLGASHTEWFWLTTLPWFTFPALPLALMSVWRHRDTAMSKESFQIAIVLAAALMAVLWQSASARDNYALPLLLPLALIAAPAVHALSARIDRFWAWGACILWGAFAVLLSATWIWMTVRHRPPRLPVIASFLPLDFNAQFDLRALLAAAALTAGLLVLAKECSRFAGRGLGTWFTGTAITWSLLSTLWLPWIDAAKSYRSVFDAVKTALPVRYECIAERGMGESELSMLSYFLGITAARLEFGEGARCDVLLINGAANAPPRYVDTGVWQAVWQGARPGDRDERFWLYTRTPPPPEMPTGVLENQPNSRHVPSPYPY